MPVLVASLVGWLIVASPTTPTPIRNSISSATAQSSQVVEKPPRPDRLVFHPHVDVPLTVGATAAWIIAEIDKTHLVATNCKWCDWAPDGTNTLNDVDSWGRRALLWHNTGRAITASNITAFVLAPAAAYGLDWRAARRDGRQSDAVEDIILISQSMAVASDVTEILKFAVGRERPFVHVLAPLAPATTPASAENNTSFPSGHTTLAFSLVTSSSAIVRLRGYTTAPWVLRIGLPIATLTAYFRIAADRHYVTDVIAGAAVGSGIGFGFPYMAHSKNKTRKIPAVNVVPTRGGQMLAAQWAW